MTLTHHIALACCTLCHVYLFQKVYGNHNQYYDKIDMSWAVSKHYRKWHLEVVNGKKGGP